MNRKAGKDYGQCRPVKRAWGMPRRALLLVVICWITGCARMLTAPSALPERRVLMREPLVIHSDFEVPPHHRLLEELQAQQDELLTKLGLPSSDEPIHVYLFPTARRYNEFMQNRYPEFPSRRAFFVETDTRLAVFAHWGDRVAEDLRHEVAHGYLHAVVPNLPLWLDEGLAEYFEVPRGHGGLNRPHVGELIAALRAGIWKPDLARLEQFDSAGQMTQLDYAESWAWVHFLLETTPERRDLLLGMLDSLRVDAAAEPLSGKLARGVDDSDRDLVQHVASRITTR